MKKYITLAALGVIGTEARKHHKKHQSLNAQKLNEQVLQQEIEELRASYAELEHRFENLEHSVQRQSLAQSPYGVASDATGQGPAYPSPQPFVRGEKQWMDNGQNIVDYADKQTTKANTRIPYQSTVQLEGPAKYGIAMDGSTPGPAYPSPQPFIRGEKQWMTNAQSINDWGDKQMTVANTRIPYASTFVGTEVEGPAKYGIASDPSGPGPAYPSPQPFTRGEKQWMDNAQNINDWQDKQMTVANTRIPYASTFVQTEAQGPALYGIASDPSGPGPAYPSPQPFTRGEKQWMTNAQSINDWGDQQMTVANTRIPYASTFVQTEAEGPAPYGIAMDGADPGPAYPSPQPFIRGEKQWMTNAQSINDWGDQQMTVANTRIPYASTFVQTGSKDFDQEYEAGVDMNILYEKDNMTDQAEKVSDANVPLSMNLVQTRQDDDPSKIEGMMMEDPNIPLNLRLVHIETKEGDELIKIE